MKSKCNYRFQMTISKIEVPPKRRIITEGSFHLEDRKHPGVIAKRVTFQNELDENVSHHSNVISSLTNSMYYRNGASSIYANSICL